MELVQVPAPSLDQSAGLGFTYSPLAGPSSIRLLKIPKFDSNKEPEYSLYHATDLQSIKYEAISYTWESPLQTTSIILNGYRFPVSAKVHALLRALTLGDEDRLVWIDFICINQDDTAEKNVQIGMMRHIFSSATRVTAWLGDDPEAAATRDFIYELAAMGQQGVLASIIGFQIYGSQVARPRLVALKRLLRNPWFRRMWVVQEIVVAADLNIMYGDVTIPWPVLALLAANARSANFLQLFQNAATSGPEVSECDTDRLFNSSLVAGIKIMYSQGCLWNLGLALESFRTFESTDPRDMVYAILGITADAEDASLKPDYHKSVEAVFVEVSKYLFTRSWDATDGKPLLTLACAGIGVPRKIKTLPSWVTDWSGNDKKYFVQSIGWLNGFKATLDTKPELDIAGRVMRIKGFEFDEVAEAGSVFEIPFGENMSINRSESLLYHSTWFHELYEMAERRVDENYPTGQSLEEVIWRTLICDKDATNLAQHHAGPEIGEAYRIWARSMKIYKRMLEIYGRERLLEALVHLHQLNVRRITGEDLFEPFVKTISDGLRYPVGSSTGYAVDEGTANSSLKEVPDDASLEGHDSATEKQIGPGDLTKLLRSLALADAGLDTGVKRGDFPVHPDLADFLPAEFPAPENNELLMSQYSSALRASFMHSFFVTKKGYVGMGPAYCKPGDRVCFLLGEAAPYLVRQVEMEGGRVADRLVGEAYVHGLMDGEAMGQGEVIDWLVFE
jgi:hypothetical protein